MTPPPPRPLLRWHGGKWRLAPWIIAHLPPHRVYTEAFGGAASVLLRKPRSYAEVYNDLDAGVVNLFRVLQEPAAAGELVARLRMTPFARAEFDLGYVPTEDRIEAARRLVIRSFMGFGSECATTIYRSGFRSTSNRSGTTPAHDWANYADALPALIDRIRGVVIESRPALELLRQQDAPDALHYVDPPYMHETRCRRNNRAGAGVSVYNHELTDDDHAELLAALRTLRGAVVLSGYPSALYDRELTDWHRVERVAHADGARRRTEVLWLNPAAAPRQARLQIEAAA